jgi:catechol 2,3-dioxygenase-like lactoylglutathione lyase family enzyme
MKISLNSVMVDDQAKALAFYTEVLGFIKKTDLSLGEFRWLTVVSPEQAGGAQLALEPDAHPAAATFKKAMYEDGIPFTAFAVDNIDQEHQRLVSLGVEFKSEPTDVGTAFIAVLDDTCGNLLQIYQEK